MPKSLPIQKHIPTIIQTLKASRCAVVQAPPGAGKTTRVPLALLNEPWLKNKKILLLEPRRLAAKSCAAHMADLLKEKVGQTIGYQIRMDKKSGPDTRIEVITQGILARKIQSDPALEETGLVIFDEFHERNIQSDLALALLLDSFKVLRDDLRILVMSATMDVKEVSDLMDKAPVIFSKGKSFPVETVYTPYSNLPSQTRQKKSVSIETACENVIKRAILETHGDLLVFLPGVKEIKTLSAMLEKDLPSKINLFPLYGNLSQKEQARVFYPSNPGERKIVIATSIAETSITIDGICVVIDSGLMRVPRFFPQTSMTRLETIPVSKASADQRRGRAGRTAPGKCYRLWSEYDHGLLQSFTKPEILSADLTGIALELAAWGVSDPKQLKWLDLPNEKSFEQAVHLLKTMGAVDEQGKISLHGKKMVLAGLHPRLAHMIIKGEEKGLGFLACRIAAFLVEKDFIRFDLGSFDPDILLRLELIENTAKKKKRWQKNFIVHQGILHRIIKSEKKIASDFGIKPKNLNPDKAGTLLALAYPDRIAQKRNSKDNTFLTSSGKGVFFTQPNPLSINKYIVAINLDGNPRNAKIFLAAPYSIKEFEEEFGDQFKKEHTVFWDKKSMAVEARDEIRFDRLVIQHHKVSKINPDRACDIMIQKIQNHGLSLLPWTKKLQQLKKRIVFLKNTGRFDDLPNVSNEALEKNIDAWLRPFLVNIFSIKQLETMDLAAAFMSLITWEQQKIIEKNAPAHMIVPSGSKKSLQYGNEKKSFESPILEVRLQEMFGLTKNLKIARGTIPITFHLLSPAGRPVQITKDLKSFWTNTYKEVRKDLMGRYPKHFWPNDPICARPTNRVKPRKGS